MNKSAKYDIWGRLHAMSFYLFIIHLFVDLIKYIYIYIYWPFKKML